MRDLLSARTEPIRASDIYWQFRMSEFVAHGTVVVANAKLAESWVWPDTPQYLVIARQRLSAEQQFAAIQLFMMTEVAASQGAIDATPETKNGSE